MASSCLLKLAIVFLVVAAPLAEATVTCGSVSKNVAQCITFLKGGVSPSVACCSGVKTLNSIASTPADRKTACGCLKSAAASIEGINYKNAAQLPAKCGVKISYAISPNTDCSKVN